VLTLPWTITDPSPDGACTVIAGRLPLRAYRDLTAVVAWVRRTRRHLAIAPGLAGHTAGVDLSGPALWIVSAWTNRADLVQFERSDQHQAAKSVLRPRMRPATFAVWSCETVDLPVTWAEVRQRIDAASQNAWPSARGYRRFHRREGVARKAKVNPT
jgi:heme-degrading monooxygenase HmoA